MRLGLRVEQRVTVKHHVKALQQQLDRAAGDMLLCSTPKRLFLFRNVIPTLEIETQKCTPEIDTKKRLGTVKKRFYIVEMFQGPKGVVNRGQLTKKAKLLSHARFVDTQGTASSSGFAATFSSLTESILDK